MTISFHLTDLHTLVKQRRVEKGGGLAGPLFRREVDFKSLVQRRAALRKNNANENTNEELELEASTCA